MHVRRMDVAERRGGVGSRKTVCVKTRVKMENPGDESNKRGDGQTDRHTENE